MSTVQGDLVAQAAAAEAEHAADGWDRPTRVVLLTVGNLVTLLVLLAWVWTPFVLLWAALLAAPLALGTIVVMARGGLHIRHAAALPGDAP